jgi:hypothetical protein
MRMNLFTLAIGMAGMFLSCGGQGGDVDADTDSDSGADSDTDTATNSDTDTATNSDTDTATNSNTDTATNSNTDTATNSDTDTDGDESCEAAVLRRESYGCEFLAADLPNDATAVDNVFAFAFVNPSVGRTSTVSVTYPTGEVETVEVLAAGMAIHELPVPRTTMISGSGVTRRAFRITSTNPVGAFMFSPWQRWDETAEAIVGSSDASVLLPTAVLGREYFAMMWSDPGEYSGPPYVTVVAAVDGTRVTVTPTATIMMQAAPYVVLAGSETTFMLNAGDVLNLQSFGASDLTGTRIVSEPAVAVFSGNACARVPDEGRFCDHLETQLPPIEAWGDVHVVSKFVERGGESDYFRILALADGTGLTFDPPRTGVPILDRGEFYEMESRESFVVTSEQPVLVGQFMASQSMTSDSGPFGTSEFCPEEIGGSCWGDPSLALVPPVAQMRRDYVYPVPDTYAYNFVNLAFRAGTAVSLDGTTLDLSAALAVGFSEWMTIALPAEHGRRVLVGDGPLSVGIHGFDHNISYACEAGMNVLDLTASD